MKDNRDPGTLDLLGSAKRGRGRPPKADSLSNAERQRRYRERRKAQGITLASQDGAVALLASTFRDLIEADARAAQLMEAFASGDSTVEQLAKGLRDVVSRSTDRLGGK